jgi:hypothetical protein
MYASAAEAAERHRLDVLISHQVTPSRPCILK